MTPGAKGVDEPKNGFHAPIIPDRAGNSHGPAGEGSETVLREHAARFYRVHAPRVKRVRKRVVGEICVARVPRSNDTALRS